MFLWSKRLEARRTKIRPAIKIDRETLMEDIKKYPDAFNYERAHRLNVSASGIRCAMKRLRISYKKNAQPSHIYIDESGFAHDMPRTHGYSKIGQRCFGTHDWEAKGRTNAIGALLGTSLLTLALFDCNINTDAFSIWPEQDLLPKLPSESILVMDNASFHKSKSMQEKIQAAGHTLEYLPPYSPDLNPIEHKWAQAKSQRRKYQCGIDELFKEHCL